MKDNKLFMIIVTVLAAIVLVLNIQKVITNNSQTDGIKFKEEYEKLNGKKNDQGKKYREITIDSKNKIVYKTTEEVLDLIDKKKSFVLYFGFDTCPWCRSVIEKFIEIASLNNIDKVYYVDIWSDDHEEILRDKYTLDEKNKPQKTVDGTDSYYKLLNYFDKFLEEYTLTTAKGKIVKIGEKRIFAPTFVYIEEGTAKKLVTGISDKQTTYNAELTDEILEDEAKIFKEFLNN